MHIFQLSFHFAYHRWWLGRQIIGQTTHFSLSLSASHKFPRWFIKEEGRGAISISTPENWGDRLTDATQRFFFLFPPFPLVNCSLPSCGSVKDFWTGRPTPAYTSLEILCRIYLARIFLWEEIQWKCCHLATFIAKNSKIWRTTLSFVVIILSLAALNWHAFSWNLGMSASQKSWHWQLWPAIFLVCVCVKVRSGPNPPSLSHFFPPSLPRVIILRGGGGGGGGVKAPKSKSTQQQHQVEG